MQFMHTGRRRFLRRLAAAGLLPRVAGLPRLASRILLPGASLVARAEAAESNDSAEPTGLTRHGGDTPLIVYLTRTQNTAALARIIGQQTGGDLLPLQTRTPYPENYRATVEQVARENDAGILPPLAPLPLDPAAYRTLFIGFPNWGMQLPPPVKSFLAAHDLRGKTLIPFLTHGGWFAGSGFRDVRRLSAGATVLDGLSVRGGLERDGILLAIQGERARQAERQVRQWLKALAVAPGR